MISIIVPVYNAQPFLERCLKSILGQTYKDIQLVLVDDGSVDRSGQICDEFAAKDSRILVIHQKNAGVSAARNAGLQAATGEYIGFVDADDYIAPDMYEQVLNQLGDHDMVMWDAVTVWPDGKTQADTIDLLKTDSSLQKKDWSPDLLRYMAGAVWRCLYRRELLEDIRFPVGIKLSEDRLFNIEAMGKANSLRYYKKALYFRSVEEGSACHRYHGDRFEKALEAVEFARKSLRRYWSEDYIVGYEKLFIIGGALDAIGEISGKNFPHKGRRKAVGSISSHPAVRAVFDASAPEGLMEKLLYQQADMGLLIAQRLRNLRKS